MQRVFGSHNYKGSASGSVVALGNFDGVHLGHQHLINKASHIAKEQGKASLVYTFDPHPVKILAPENCPPLLQTLEQKLSTLESLGINTCIIETFTHEYAKLKPDAFFKNILVDRLKATHVVIGYDFTFGFHRSGTVEIMEQCGTKNGIAVTVIEAQFIGDLLLGSTEIRRLLSLGAIDRANKMLGRPYRLEGKVVSGKGIGGYLGAHTANIQSLNELIPTDGVYLTKTLTNKGNEFWPSVTSIGHNPTFPCEPLSVETHLLDFKGNLKDEDVAIDFLDRKRDQIAFHSVEDLQKQIKKDIEESKEWHEKNKELHI